MTAVDTAAAVACRATHPVRWEYRATTTPCDSCLTGARGLEEAGLLRDGETRTEWNVYDDGLIEVYLQPWCEDKALVEEYVESGRTLVTRERTTYPDRVTEWKPVES